MNDVPVVVAWIGAVLVTALVALVWRPVRRLPAPSTPRWAWRALAWAGAAATLGPFVVVPTLVIISVMVDWRVQFADPEQAIAHAVGGVLYLGMWYLVISLAFFMLPYIPLLLLWARLGPSLGPLENTRRGLVLSSAVLAVPGALVSVIAYGVLDEPFGYAGAELLRFGLLLLGALTVSLLVPRLLCSPLRAGAFAGSRGKSPVPGAA